jgi:hypothetical protein
VWTRNDCYVPLLDPSHPTPVPQLLRSRAELESHPASQLKLPSDPRVRGTVWTRMCRMYEQVFLPTLKFTGELAAGL